MALSETLSILGVISGGSSVIYAIWRYGYKAGIEIREKQSVKESIEKISTKLDKFIGSNEQDIINMELRLKVVENTANSACLKIEPFWDLIKTNLPIWLNLPHSENMVSRLTDDRITNDELKHLEEEVTELLDKDREYGNRVFVDLMALWAIRIRKKERGLD